MITNPIILAVSAEVLVLRPKSCSGVLLPLLEFETVVTLIVKGADDPLLSAATIVKVYAVPGVKLPAPMFVPGVIFPTTTFVPVVVPKRLPEVTVDPV